MTNTVPCPECPRPATVLDRFWIDGADGPTEYLRLQCEGNVTFLATAAEVGLRSQPPALATAA